MKFGGVEKPGKIDFTLPPDHPDTARVLSRRKAGGFRAYVGCAKWNRADLKKFYPRGIKDELAYYSRQFNCIELNATFYRVFPLAQFEEWRATVPPGFKFFPKLSQMISHMKRLNDVERFVDENVTHFSALRDRLGVPFLQLHNNFAPKDFDRVRRFIADWRYDLRLAIEFRHTNWFNEPEVSRELYALLEKRRMINVLVDTAGRRDLLHMRLTAPKAFVRYVGANHRTDFDRLDVWVERIARWKEAGLRELYFFVHQNQEQRSPLLAAYFIKKLNQAVGTELAMPKLQMRSNRLRD